MLLVPLSDPAGLGGWHCLPHPERLIANQELFGWGYATEYTVLQYITCSFKAIKYKIGTFASQVARYYAIVVYPQAYDEPHSCPYQETNLPKYLVA